MNAADGMPLFRDVIGSDSPNGAKDLLISKCDVHKACELNQLWHSRFPKIDWSNVVRNKDYICFVAEYNAIAYAVAIWSSPIAGNRLKNGATALELRRLAISDDAPRNTASRMISVMRKEIQRSLPHIDLLLSYQDTDVHLGTIYKASGWTVAASSQGISWSSNSRKRNKEQSMSPKIRWEFRIKSQ